MKINKLKKLDLADTHHLERYLTECGYNVVEITEGD